MLLSVDLVAEPGNESFSVTMPDVDLIFFHNSLTRCLYDEGNVVQCDNNIAAFE